MIEVLLHPDHYSDQEIVAKTLYGEARNQHEAGIEGVGNVIKNRATSGVSWWGTTPRSVCLKPFQFSCWNSNDPNLPIIMAVQSDNPIYQLCLRVAVSVIDGTLVDNVKDADSYFVKAMPNPPKWAIGLTPVAEIGAHVFYRTRK